MQGGIWGDLGDHNGTKAGLGRAVDPADCMVTVLGLLPAAEEAVGVSQQPRTGGRLVSSFGLAGDFCEGSRDRARSR